MVGGYCQLVKPKKKMEGNLILLTAVYRKTSICLYILLFQLMCEYFYCVFINKTYDKTGRVDSTVYYVQSLEYVKVANISQTLTSSDSPFILYSSLFLCDPLVALCRYLN